MKLLRVAEGCFSKQEVETPSWTVVGWASVTLEATPISLSLSLSLLFLSFSDIFLWTPRAAWREKAWRAGKICLIEGFYICAHTVKDLVSASLTHLSRWILWSVYQNPRGGSRSLIMRRRPFTSAAVLIGPIGYGHVGIWTVPSRICVEFLWCDQQGVSVIASRLCVQFHEPPYITPTRAGDINH